MLAYPRGIGRYPKYQGHRNAGAPRPIRRTSIRVLAPLVASAAVLLLMPAIASADTAVAGAAADQTSTGTAEIASITIGVGPSLFGLDLAALLWVLVAVLAVAAGLIGGSRSVAGAPAGAGLAQNSAAQLSVVAPVTGQSSFGTRQATGTNNDPNGA